MSGNRSISDITRATEEQVRHYFDQRGWSVQKLDKPKADAVAAADWLFCKDEICFLCEVKTITSVRKGLNKEAHFTQFARMLDERFSAPTWSTIPLSVSIHSDTVYQPPKNEADKFIDWLGSALLLLRDDTYIYGWTRDVMPWGGKVYSTYYTFGTTPQGGEISFSVHVSTTTDNNQLEIHSYVYGDFHDEKIDDNIIKARDQLKKTAQRQPDPAIARVVALAFAGSSGGDVAFDWHMVSKTISELLPQYHDISAVAAIHFTHKDKYKGNNFFEWLLAEMVPYFVVFHNRWLDPNINQLDISAFLDDYSFQLSPL